MQELIDVPYMQGSTLCEPSREEIEIALNTGQLDERGFQSHLQPLYLEWSRVGLGSAQWFRLIQTYHARRIAYFIRNGWSDPISLRADGVTVLDGHHRLKAAIYLAQDVIEVEIMGPPARVGDRRKRVRLAPQSQPAGSARDESQGEQPSSERRQADRRRRNTPPSTLNPPSSNT